MFGSWMNWVELPGSLGSWLRRKTFSLPPLWLLPRCWLELASLRVGWPGSRSCPGSVLTTFYTLPRSDPNDYFVFHKCAKWWHYQNGRQWSWSNPNEGEQVSKEQTRCCWCGGEPKTPAQEVNQGGFLRNICCHKGQVYWLKIKDLLVKNKGKIIIYAVTRVKFIG